MISIITPFEEAHPGGVSVTYPRIALKRPCPGAGDGDLEVGSPVQKQARKTPRAAACQLCLGGQGGHLAHVAAKKQ